MDELTHSVQDDTPWCALFEEKRDEVRKDMDGDNKKGIAQFYIKHWYGLQQDEVEGKNP